jgi:hypothetical protein
MVSKAKVAGLTWAAPKHGYPNAEIWYEVLLPEPDFVKLCDKSFAVPRHIETMRAAAEPADDLVPAWRFAGPGPFEAAYGVMHRHFYIHTVDPQYFGWEPARAHPLRGTPR